MAACLCAARANAGLNFSFTFPALGGGSVSGEIFGLKGGTSAATDVLIFSQPSGFGLSLPLDLFTAPNALIGSNTFTISGNSIVAENFAIVSDPASLILNSAAPSFLLENNSATTFALASGAISFAQVPEPMTLMLLLSGIAGLVVVRRGQA